MKATKTTWKVKVAKAAEQDLEEMAKSGTLSDDDKIVIRKWAQTIIEDGPEALRVEGSIWKDHELTGQWADHRASSFSPSGRMIDGNVVRVTVVRITPTHDYEKENKR
jgi:mRNA-degrading endonuclease YafQ of YafQ-DinJ toxin-antitoxin module